jgi:hypothetical protein
MQGGPGFASGAPPDAAATTAATTTTTATPVAPDALPFADSLCHACANLRLVRTATSTYMLCTALATKYPRQPVVACPAFSARNDGR